MGEIRTIKATGDKESRDEVLTAIFAAMILAGNERFIDYDKIPMTALRYLAVDFMSGCEPWALKKADSRLRDYKAHHERRRRGNR